MNSNNPDSAVPVSSSGVGEPGVIERVRRFSTVALLAARVYAGYKAIQLWDRATGSRRSEERYRGQDLRSARALYRTAVKLEGLLIKASQFIATRADLLPDEWVNTLSGLHDRVPARPFATIRGQIERELKKPLETIFYEFDETPLASASLAQVHRARLRDGRRCAVKVQYPGIEAIVRLDLKNFTFVLRALAFLEPDFDFRVIVREALKYVPMELDFEHEATNAETMRRNFASDPTVIVPEVYREYTTRRVLTMELVDGIKISDVEALERAGIDRRTVAQRLTEVFCEQILRDGFFHADPHPGNIFVKPGPALVFLDFGLAKDFPQSFRDGFVRLTLAILIDDRDGIVRAFRELGFRTRNGSPETLLTLSEAFLGSAIRHGKAYATPAFLKEFSDKLHCSVRENPVVEVPADVLLVARVMGLLSGLGKTLDSQVDLFTTIMPYARQLLAEPASAASE